MFAAFLPEQHSFVRW